MSRPSVAAAQLAENLEVELDLDLLGVGESRKGSQPQQEGEFPESIGLYTRTLPFTRDGLGCVTHVRIDAPDSAAGVSRLASWT